MIDTTLILISLVTFLVGGGVGFAIYHFTLSKEKSGAQKQALEDSKAEMEQYKSQVNSHFKDSAQLMGQVATSYQALHSHMASQSQTLLSEEGASAFPLLETTLDEAQEKPALSEEASMEKGADTPAEEHAEQAAESAHKADDSSKDVDDSAQKAANSAEKAADSAENAAGSAEKTADNAEKTADSAEKTADSAEKSADSAEKSADSAQKTADTADQVAENAEKVADKAEKVADKAESLTAESPAKK